VNLRATIVIDIEAEDYIAAGESQRQLRTWLSDLQAQYRDVTMDVRQRRSVRPKRSSRDPVVVLRPTGRLNRYEDPA
jgi:hypothetical protein